MKSRIVSIRSISLVCILILLSSTFQGIAQTNENVTDASKAMLDAQGDAEQANVDAWGWAGGLLGPMGILIAAVYTPTPPIARLIGQSSEYVAIYTATYQEKVKGRQVKHAATGCAGATLATFFLYLITENQL